MTGYVKLFSSILGSSIWQQDSETRLVWITLLALADKHGEVRVSVPGLAHLARVELDACETALEYLSQPDPYSQSTVAEGRRIQPIAGGWEVVNFTLYRHLMSAEEQAERNRIRQQRYRARQKVTLQPSPSVTADSHDVDPRHAPIRELIQEQHLKLFRVKCQWDGSEAKGLSSLLAANPSWTIEQMSSMIENRFASENIASSRPRKWLPSLGEYAAGRLDRYGRLCREDVGRPIRYLNDPEYNQEEQ